MSKIGDTMTKVVSPITAQLVTFESSRPYPDVIANLDEALNKARSPEALLFMKGGKTRDELVGKFTEVLGDRDFLYGSTISCSRANGRGCMTDTSYLFLTGNG
jgi:hypothetical protein